MRTSSGETVVVLGASTNPFRYSHVAVKELAARGYHVVAVGRKNGRIENIDVSDSLPVELKAHTATVYLSPERQESYETWLMSGNVRRVIFNPGAENIHLKQRLEGAGVEVIWNCTLVMLSTGGF